MTRLASVLEQLGLAEDDVELHGRDRAKLPLAAFEGRPRDGRLVLVSAMNPTKWGEGKTTTTIGLGDGLRRLGLRTTIALRDPSLGPTLGTKGGGTGGGLAHLVPRHEIDLGFTGDSQAVGSAHNLLACLADNTLHHAAATLGARGRVVLRRVTEHHDRTLRHITLETSGQRIETGFDVVAASEVMAILCLARDLADLEQRLASMLVGFTRGGEAVYARDIGASSAMTVLLRHVVKPNLVRSAEGTPVLLHGGPFANIAHGTNSILATRAGLALSEVVVTEAGFGFDLGGEKFLDLVCPVGDFTPAVVVLVVSVRALKAHAGPGDAQAQGATAIRSGLANLDAHLDAVALYGLPVVVAINRFAGDSDEEIDIVVRHGKDRGVTAVACTCFRDGGPGALALARAVSLHLSGPSPETRSLQQGLRDPEERIREVAQRVYGAATVELTERAQEDLALVRRLGHQGLPVCIAKTPRSLSDDPSLLGRPRGFSLRVREVRIAAGAGFLVPLAGSILTLPGLPACPRALALRLGPGGKVTGLD
jgi:formate--tetrahydrofolate ligase